MEGLEAVRRRVAAALALTGRPAGTVRLVAVSKRHTTEAIREVYQEGQRDFGESYAQELQEKATALGDLADLRWHFIGHLQRNKAKLVAPRVALVHTIDSVDLARELVRRAPAQRSRGLIEVNLAREAQKSGVDPDDARELASALLAIPGLSLEGLMCVPPAGEAPRPHFAVLRSLRDDLAAALGIELPELSMGMSDDFEIAIAEGSTLVRVGTAIFGPRP